MHAARWGGPAPAAFVGSLSLKSALPGDSMARTGARARVLDDDDDDADVAGASGGDKAGEKKLR